MAAYPRRITVQLIIALVLGAPVLLVLFSVGRAAWRLVVRNESPDAGGSQGRQMWERESKKPAA